MNILVVGSGGREHAICKKISESDFVDNLYCAPGNAGIGEIAKCVDIGVEDIEGICRFAGNDIENGIDMVVVGPEIPLAMGLVDALEEIGVKTFGPNKDCARLEASKSFTKDFLKRHAIPTADYREYDDMGAIIDDIGIFGYPMVIKADGLAAGKGVILAEDRDVAEKAIREIMDDKIFGKAGDRVVVEECLIGTEASVLCFVDEHTIVAMESAQDYKRIFDGDNGPNTGGMGTYSPSLVFTEELSERIESDILKPTLTGFQKDGLKFKGVLFIGLMITKDGPKVIEFNNRFGDPEAQTVLPRLDSDLVEIMSAVCENRLKEITIRWRKEKAVCVILASGGYPESYEKGKPIFIAEDLDQDIILFHSGTKMAEDGSLLSWGGRVMGVTALGDSHEDARQKVYDNIDRIQFDGMQYRKDIGIIIG